MSAVKRLIDVAIFSGYRNSAKVVIGLVRMHWRYFFLGRGRGLIKLIPMEVPMKIHVDPASGCNFRCFFCPQSNPQQLRENGFPTKSMPLSLFRKLVDDMGQLNGKVDELVLGNYGEPLINKNLAEMVRYAKASRKIREVSVITNASLLDGRVIDGLARSGLDKIRISIESLSDAGYLKTTGIAQSFEKIVSNIRKFKAALKSNGQKTFIYIKIIDANLTSDEKNRFFSIFLPLADAVSIENLMGITDKSIEMVEMDPKGMTGVGLSKGRKVCPSPFYSLSIHSNGEVGVCCSDWSHKTIVGSIETERIGDIWKGEQLQKFREDQLNKSWRGMAACAGCEMVHHYPKYEDLDNFIDQIKQKGI